MGTGAAVLREEVLQFLGQRNLHWRCHGRFRISGTVFRGVEGLTGRALALDFASLIIKEVFFCGMGDSAVRAFDLRLVSPCQLAALIILLTFD